VPHAFEIEARMGGLGLKGWVGDIVLKWHYFPIYIFKEECWRERREIRGGAKEGDEDD
jgi:hypothetical protein